MESFQAAIPPLRQALALQPSNLQARSLLGMACYGAGLYDQATVQLEKVAADQTQNAALSYVLAESYLRSSQFEKVLEVFEKLQREVPRSAAARMLMGEALDGLDRTTEAIREFQVAAAIDPGQPNVHFGLGYLYWKTKKFDEAEQTFNQELRNVPGHTQAKAYLGDIYFRRNQFEAATRLLEEVVKSSQDIHIAYLDLGTLYANQKQYSRSVTMLKAAIRLEPSRTDAHYRLAQTYRSMGRHQDMEA